ncbi:putative molybdenum carrier protein [Methyloligella sp. 2.7D]|uniref:putative molybdenum carrier protein n=1 Tax=unclassified Methyloligella TaxID=2625955 RepID=UPI00157D55DE|nr:putative molybdenum carrier protein [Methyloligella sp. GL2]QKP77721.1 molybdenum cofactor carrier [Methyloligella sp. GL2]
MLKIISGGQSGVDRAALDVAVAHEVPYGGWCPQGGWAEDKPEPPGVLKDYPALRETPSADPAMRTEWNIRDADAALFLTDASGLAVSPGSQLAERLAETYRTPVMVWDMDAEDGLQRAIEWLTELTTAHRVDQHFRIAIGGPRESEAPGIYAKAKAALETLLRALD